MDFVHQFTAHRIRLTANTFLQDDFGRAYRLLQRSGHHGRKNSVGIFPQHRVGSGLSGLYPVQGKSRTGAVKTGGPV
jgi:hypothetical protein